MKMFFTGILTSVPLKIKQFLNDFLSIPFTSLPSFRCLLCPILLSCFCEMPLPREPNLEISEKQTCLLLLLPKCTSKEKTEFHLDYMLTSNFPIASPHATRKLCLMIQESALAGVFRLLFFLHFFLIPNLLKG